MTEQNQLIPLNVEEPTTYFGLIEKVGSKGRYQTLIFLIFCLVWFVTGFLLLGPSFIFMTGEPDCTGRTLQGDDCNYDRVCKQANWREYFKTNQPDSLIYFRNQYLCDDTTTITVVKSMTYAGCFFGYVFFSFFADNFGRKYTMLLTWAITCVGFLLVCVSWHISVVGIGLFLAGAGADSAINIAFFFFNEVVEYQRRQYYSIAVQIAFNLGGMAISGIFYVMPHWRNVFIFAMLIPSLLAMALMYYLEETPRFLLKKQNQYAIQVLNGIAVMNGHGQGRITLEDIERVKQQEVQQKQFQKMITPIDIFRYRSLRTKSICCCMVSFCIYNLYYGPIIIIDKIGLNIYINQIVLCASELLTYSFTFFLIAKIPRKLSGSISFIVSAAMTCIIIFIPNQQIIGLVLISVARFSLSMYFSIFLIWNNELYPASARGIGTGIASAVGTVASTTNPYVLQACTDNGFDPMIIFTAIAIIAFIFLIPLGETLNKPLLDEIEEIFVKKSIFKSVRKNSLIKTKTDSMKIHDSKPEIGKSELE